MSNNYTIDTHTAFAIAVGSHNFNDMTLLLQAHPHLLNEPNSADYNRTPFFIAARFFEPSNEDSIKIFEYFLENGIEINTLDRKGNTVLHEAVLYNPKAIQFILNKGASVNLQNDYGSTPLHFCAESEKISSAEIDLLLNNGADPLVRDNIGWTPYHKAILTGNNFELLKVLLKADNSFAKLELPLSIREESNIHKLFQDKELSKEDLSHNIEQTLHAIDISTYFAPAKSGRMEIIDLLLQESCGTIIRDNEGDTLLHYAAAYGHPELVERLIKCHKFPVNIKDNSGYTPLDFAKQAGQQGNIETLQKAGELHDNQHMEETTCEWYNSPTWLECTPDNEQLSLTGNDISYYTDEL